MWQSWCSPTPAHPPSILRLTPAHATLPICLRAAAGCASLRELPPALAAALPLRHLNLLHTGVLRLPLAAGAARLEADGSADGGEEQASGSGSGSGLEHGGAGDGPSYLQHLTELRWGVAEWEAAGGHGPGGARRWVGPSGVLAAAGLPDLSPLLQASGLRVLQLVHVPASADVQLAVLRRRLPQLHHLQVNSAVLLP